VDRLVVKAIPELMHCGLGFDPEINSFGRYDMAFLKRDILPNVTTLIVPSSIKLVPSVINDWHHQGKRFVAEVGINGQARTADEHSRFWAGFFDRSPFLDGIIDNEFIVNNPSTRPGGQLSPERTERMNQERTDTACTARPSRSYGPTTATGARCSAATSAAAARR
jgi:hypothetical protein